MADFVTQPTIVKKDLAVRESILGVLKAKDRADLGTIRVADFEKVISDFGLTRESLAVKNVLAHCSVDASENLDFNQLKQQLATERNVHNAKAITSKKPNKSKGAIKPAIPQVAGLRKEELLSKKRQEQAVQELTAEVLNVYKMLAHHEIDRDAAVHLLSQHHIYPTKEFVKVASKMATVDVSFTDFSRALTNSDPYFRTQDIAVVDAGVVNAGSKKPAPLDKFAAPVLSTGKRVYKAPKSKHFALPDEVPPVEVLTPGKRLAESVAYKSSVGGVLNENGRSSLGDNTELDLKIEASYGVGRRHATVDQEQGALDLARAQLSHGDCISWQQGQTELEIRNASMEKPSGRKVSFVGNCR